LLFCVAMSGSWRFACPPKAVGMPCPSHGSAFRKDTLPRFPLTRLREFVTSPLPRQGSRARLARGHVMGTETSTTIRPPDKRSRPLWQVPIFLFGVAVLALAWFMRSPVDVGRRQVATLLSRASQNLEHPDGDVEVALDDAQQAVDRIGPDGERA